MWLALRIGVLYAAPVIAVVLAFACCVVLVRRVRRGALARADALRRFAWTLLLPPAVMLVVWGMGELASRFAVGDQYVFDAGASLAFLASLLPLAAYVLAPILLLFGALLAFARAPR